MKKRILSLCLTAGLILSLAACGDSKPAASKEQKETTAASGTETKKAETTKAAETLAAAETTAEASYEGTQVDTDYFSFVYGDDWTYDPEEDLSEYSECIKVSPQVPDTETGSDKVYVEIEVSLDDAALFADALFRGGIDAEKAVKGEEKYPTRTIGGIDCWILQKGTATDYYGYIPEANAFVNVYVSENDQSDLTDPLIDSIKFKVGAYTEDVTPWYWDGTPYHTEACTTEIGSFTVTGKQLPITPVHPSFKTFDARIQVHGNEYYVLDNNQMKKYIREGDELKFDSDVELPYSPSEYAVDAEGALYLSASNQDLIRLQNGTETKITSGTSHIAFAPSCSWAVSYYAGKEVTKIDLTTGELTPLTPEGLLNISYVAVTEHYIVLSCTLDNADRTACLKIYDTDFNELNTIDKTMTTTGFYGAVSAVTETENGLVVFDGNMRDIYFLDHDLNLIAAADMEDVLGTGYPWPGQAVTLEDGSVIVICTDDRADRSCDEAVVFQMNGF